MLHEEVRKAFLNSSDTRLEGCGNLWNPVQSPKVTTEGAIDVRLELRTHSQERTRGSQERNGCGSKVKERREADRY